MTDTGGLDKTDEDRAARMFAEALTNDPVAALSRHIDDTYDEAKLWLDGEKVADQAQADALGQLFTMLDDGYKLVEAERVKAKKPHDDKAAAVQATFVPIRDKADKARKAVKRAIQTWNDEQAELLQIEAARVRKEADDAARQAREEINAAIGTNNLAAIEVAEQQLEVADTLADMASRAEKAKAITQTGGARGIGKVPMRWAGRLDADPLDLEAVRAAEHALMLHFWGTRRKWLVQVMLDEAAKDIKAGTRMIPGLSIKQEKVGG